MIFSFIEAWSAIQPLLFFLIGMTVYAIFIFSFYRFLARKDLFKISLAKYNVSKNPVLKKTVRIIFYILEHILIYPLFVIFWFAILGLLLAFLSKNEGIETIMLVTAAIISSVRITAYINESLSSDLAKMLPFALLGIFLIDISYFSITNTEQLVMDAIPLWGVCVYYVVFIIALEIFLRLLSTLFSALFKKKAG